MSTLRDDRLRALHSQFLDAAKRYSFLTCAAVTPQDADPFWPKIPHDFQHGESQLGLSASDLNLLVKMPNRAFPQPVSDAIWLKMGGRLWESVFYCNQEPDRYRNTTSQEAEAEYDKMKAEYEACVAAVKEFKRLARQAAGHLDIDRRVQETNEYPQKDDPADRWLEKILELPFAETGNPENSMLVLRLPFDVFSASARAIEQFAQPIVGAVQTAQADLLSDRRVVDLLLLLWRAENRDAGIAIVDLPEPFGNEELLTTCEFTKLIEFGRRNHCHRGGGQHRKLVLEDGWNFTSLDKPNKKRTRQLLDEANTEQVEPEIRLRVRLTYHGEGLASGVERLPTPTEFASDDSTYANVRKIIGDPVSRSLGITLSGGGLRATLFHLGIFVLLARKDRLKDVKEIVAVSGGSILAAHFAKDWEIATKDAAGFNGVAAALVGFARSNVRDAVLIPWIWSRLLFCWWKRSLGRTARLQRAYKKHFGQTTLGNLAHPYCPRIAIVATDALKQERVAFTADHIMRFPLDSLDGPDERRIPDRIVSRGVELSLAVTASSCFPPVFRRMHLDHRDLGLKYAEFKETLALNDGGVTDNLGSEVLLALRPLGWGLAELTLIGDAERPQTTKPKDGLFADANAHCAALSKGAREGVRRELGVKCDFISLSDRIPESSGLPFRMQTLLANFRTDLDAPSWHEIQALMLHGAVVAAEVTGGAPTTESVEGIRATISKIIKEAGGPESLKQPAEADLRASHWRPCRCVLLHACFVVVIMVVILSTIGYWVSRARQNSPTEELRVVVNENKGPTIVPPPFDFPSPEVAGVKPLTDEERSSKNFADAKMVIRNETNKKRFFGESCG